MDKGIRKLITVVTEASLERQLTRDLETLGASGYTITDARGRGTRGVRRSGWENESNIRIEIVCDVPLSDRIVAQLQERYYTNYAMVLWIEDVEVLRPPKFS